MRWIAHILFINICIVSGFYSPLTLAQNLDDLEAEMKDQKDFTPESEAIVMSLKVAIEKGLRKNNPQKIRDYSREIIELNFQDAFEEFWLPQLNLTVQTNDHYVESFYSDQEDNTLPKSPNGYVGIEFEEYTVFNWGRDYLNYLNQKATYEREKQRLTEQKRFLRFQIIDQYFNTKRLQKIRRIKRSQLRHTSFMYRLNKEKLALKKINKQQLFQAKGEFLRAHKEYQDANAEAAAAEEQLAELVGDSLDTTYTLTNEIKVKPFTLGKGESINFAKLRSPTIRQARVDLHNSNRDFERTRKENLPLPKFSVRLGAYRNSFSKAGNTETVTTNGNSRNVELAASINMTWRLFGSGGLFNSRDLERSYFNKRISEINFSEARREISTNINVFHKRIKYLEKEIEATRLQRDNNRNSFDITLDRYIAGKTDFPNMKLVLDGLIQAEENYENAKYEHMSERLNLANFIGIDDFPGEKFEDMILK